MDEHGASEHLIRSFLSAAVPLWIFELQKKPLEHLMKRKNICAQIVAGKGDVFLYGSKKTGASADVANHLAEGVAILALIAKGGVEIFGLKFEAKHPEITS